MDLFKDNTLATWCEELTHLKRPWCWEWLKAGGEGDDRGWDGWMASSTQWTWARVSSISWWWIGKPGMLQSMGSQRVRYDWATKLNWTETFHRQNAVYLKRWEWPWKQHTPQSVGHLRRWQALKLGMASFMGSFHRLMSARIIPTIWGKGQKFPKIRPLPTFWPFIQPWDCLGTYRCII